MKVKLVNDLFTRHLLIVEGDDDPVHLGVPGHEADPEHGAPRGLHPSGDVVPRLRGHQDLQVPLPGLRRVHCYESGVTIISEVTCEYRGQSSKMLSGRQ